MDLSNLDSSGLLAAARGVVGSELGGVLDQFDGQLLSFADRNLRLQWSANAQGALAPILLPHRAKVTEGLCEGVTARITCVSTRTAVPWSAFKGLPVALQIVGPGSVRSFPLFVDEIRQGQSDAALTVVQLTGRDALTYMNRRRRLRTFRHQSALDVVTLVLQDWMKDPNVGPCFTFTLLGVNAGDFPVRDLFVQHPGESDGAFVRRLLRGVGLAWAWRAKPAAGLGDLPQQELVLFNDPDALPANDTASMPFHQRTGDPLMPEVIDELARTWRMVPAASELRSWDSKMAAIRTAAGLSGADQGPAGDGLANSMSEVRVVDPHHGEDGDELDRLAQVQADSHAFRAQCFDGRGSVRSMAPGTVHTVTDCPLFDADALPALAGGALASRLVTVWVEHFAQSNLPKALDAFAQTLVDDEGIPAWARLDDHAAAQRYANHFTAVLAGTPIVPSYLPERDDPPLRRLVGVVVVPDGDDGELHTDDLGCALVQLQGGESGADTTVPLRHLAPWAGTSHGFVAHYRRGTEVVVDFYGPDRPFVLGALPNGATPPARLSHLPSLPANKAQTALVSRELESARQQHLLFDDTPGQIMTQLATEAGDTAFSLGELTAPRHDGRARPRGNGFDLSTAHHGTLRTAMRLLISAWGQADAAAPQLDAQAHERMMQTCLDLFRALGQYAAQNQGLPLDDAPQAALLAAIQAEQDFDDPSKAGEPTISITAPAGVATTTPRTILHYAGTNIDSVAQQHLNLTAGQQFNLNAGRGLGLFAHHEGLRAIAHDGPLTLQAQHDSVQVDAANDIRWSAVGGKLVGMAQEIHLIAADGSFIKIGGGITLGTNGAITQQAASFPHQGPATMSTAFPTFGSGSVDQRFVLRAGGFSGPALANTPHDITLSDGSTVSGVSDAQGQTSLLQRDAMHIADLRIHKKDE